VKVGSFLPLTHLPTAITQVIAVFFWLCVVSVTITAARSNEVIVMSPHNRDIKTETERAFAAWHQATYGEPAIIRWKESGGGTSNMNQFIVGSYEQSQGDGIGIDVFYGGGVGPYHDLKAKGLLEKWEIPRDIAGQIPQRLGGFEIYDPEHCWYGAALSSFGILTNERIRKTVGLPEVKTWADLADPRLQSWVSSADPRQSGSVLMIYEIILQAYGWEKGWAVLAGMNGNVRTFLKSAGGTAKEASLGEVAYAVAIDIYGRIQVDYLGPENMSFILPAGGTVINPDAIAILKKPSNPEMADRFMRFVLGQPGQFLWMLPARPKLSAGDRQKLGADAQYAPERYTLARMSIQPRLYTDLAGITPVRTDPYKLDYPFTFDTGLQSKRRKILGGLIGAWFVDLHERSAEAWIALNKSPHRERLFAEYARPPVTSDELLALAKNDWKNPIKQNELINQWQSQAAALYEKIISEAGRP
jgi:ABC-type Fe3+ transport system substrate-binding protein